MPDMGKALVQLTGAGLFRGGRWLVRGVDLDVQAGEIVTLIGPNGSGKSTTAKMALGIINPDEGRARRAPSLRVGYVPQTVAIDWTLPLRVSRFMRLTGNVSDKAVSDALALTGASGLGDNEVRTLSGGEFQRVMLARALALDPQLLVLDEPVQGVDFAGEVAIYDLIRRIRHERGCGVLLISHDLHVVMAATDRVICLNGHVCCQGTPTDVAANESYRSLFGQRAAATLAFYEHHHDHTHLPDGRVRDADGTVTESCHPGDGHHNHNHAAGHDHA